MSLAITSLYAAVIALIFIALSLRVIRYRRANRIGLGDAGDKSLLKRMRAQANCAEYAPIGLILLAMVEGSGAPGMAVHLLGSMLVIGRLAHGIGFSASPPIMAARVAGTFLTLMMILLAATGLLIHAVI